MIVDHWACPITSIEGKLLGIEIQSHVERDGVRILAGIEEEVLSTQLRLVEGKAAWFRDNNLFCVMGKGTITTKEYLPFLRQMTTTTRIHEKEWLDDLGVYGGSAIPLVTGDFEVVRLNRRYTQEIISRLIFPVLIKSIRQYCDKVIVPVQDKTYYKILKDAGVWAVQGEYKPIRFEQCEKLL
ncbi:hypothetical protein I7V27_00015 [Lelliottia amnigena]|uniref:Uncharacterized protein n=1 Tax=Lelliottia amnigena TaxID=61646 RepID=A0AAP2A992_LELAM|nr:hypothetical protein [Lelliottia amnigena]MBL5897348.1 hypothetical protein [Lelliottia amnigena]MBL5932860.1 hypothetical protein [Lelliottia amnigena]